MTEGNERIELTDHVFPMEFISMEKVDKKFEDSVLLTSIQHLLSLPWPSCPVQPPAIDIGSSIENFVRNLISKNKLDNIVTDKNVEDLKNCQVVTTGDQTGDKPTSIDYNQFLKLLQTVLNKAPT